MRCTSPRTVGFLDDGKTITFSPKTYSKEYAPFQLPCGKCLSCRLEYGRQWAVRCMHEASTHEQNCFITLTYAPEHLKSPKLNYFDFQLFMKRLRKKLDDKKLPHQIGYFVTGEYGEINKRPHWHACLFGFRPSDATYAYSNDRGDKNYTSALLTDTWALGKAEFGDVTFESAGYCARYAAKKLIHGKDQEHDYHPISKKSSKHAIGRRWLERNFRDVFNHGLLVLPDGSTCGIPRYYEKWFAKNHSELYLDYLLNVKYPQIQEIEKNSEPEYDSRRTYHRPLGLSRSQVRDKLLKLKFNNQLQKHLKL